MNRSLFVGVTRRRLLHLAGILSGGLLVGGGCREADDSKRDVESRDESVDLPLRHAIRKHFAYLSIDDQLIETFARDLSRHQGRWNPDTSPRPYTRFLASTDFFQNGADEARPLRYVAFYDPYVTPCYNPFASST
ncbi:MAG: hypothetical protein JRG89_02590 [Deltaproteobacteria bacterium]|nr:hypothetical protein [Deltaproteobacteria bacterium]MBW2387300.1 hypothetical protein [Deltaproteobacteria bacterium]MBW2723109.1 hypothetical protein [Deltaproteobacteria bacterium]